MAQKKFILALFLLTSLCRLSRADFFPDDPDEELFPPRHERLRRFIRVVSRKPHPDAPPETGIGFRGHMKNLLKGGTLKVELRIPFAEKFGKTPFYKEFFPPRGEDGEKKFKDYEMLERGGEDYGPLINPRIKTDP